MNYKKLGEILGKIMILEGALMLAPLAVTLIYQEGLRNVIAFAIPIVVLCGFGFLLQLPKPKRESLYQKEGFALVALVWIVMALFGAIPFVINRDIPNYIDAFFEITSGFTTTGASILRSLDISKSSLFWRSFSHWIGGMGILVFILIFIPESNEGSSMHLLRAESPGPQVGKIASKMKVTARILYLIYLGMTVLEFIILMFSKPIPGYENDKVFINLLTCFGSAGTGGFGIIPGSLELYSPFSQYVVSIFLILFGCNFTIYYLLLLGKIKDILRSEEVKTYFIILISATTLIFVNLVTNISQLSHIYTTEEAFRYSLFQVASIVTTTGYSTTDFGAWPILSQTVLVCLMIFGAMAGSTAGGFKISRVVITAKGMYVNIRKLINPRYVPKAKMEGKTLEEKTISSVFAFATMYGLIIMLVTLILSFDPINGTQTVILSDTASVYSVTHGFATNFSASLSCISNIGPGIEAVGPYSSFAAYSMFSKVILSLTMIVGRLEILPVIILFSPRTWKKT